MKDQESHSTYWIVQTKLARYAFPSEQAAEMFASNHDGEVFKQ